MLQFIELTDAERDQIAAFNCVYRPMMGEVARMLAKMTVLTDSWQATVLLAVDRLAADAVVPSTTDLAGASDMTAQQMKDSLVDFQIAVDTFNTAQKRQTYVLAAGLPNTIGR